MGLRWHHPQVPASLDVPYDVAHQEAHPFLPFVKVVAGRYRVSACVPLPTRQEAGCERHRTSWMTPWSGIWRPASKNLRVVGCSNLKWFMKH